MMHMYEAKRGCSILPYFGTADIGSGPVCSREAMQVGQPGLQHLHSAATDKETADTYCRQ